VSYNGLKFWVFWPIT